MGLFEQFPFADFHQLNLDWIIRELKKRGENVVLSVNGETGDVVLYKSENIVFPSVDSNTWRMVRVADGHTAGVMFQNGLMYVMFDNAAERVYTVDHPPTYPVTSVDGQTGAVRVFPDAATRLPDVTEDKTNIRRQIRDSGVDHIVGIEIDKDKATRMDDNHRYKIYDEGNTPDIVTSVNGASGAVIIAIPFEDTETDNILFADAASGHEWSLGRETLDGIASIQLETDSSSAAAYLRFYTEDDPPVSFVKKLLTTDDIPSSAGVVSVNGQNGVVTIYGDTMPVESGAARSMKEYTDDVSSGLGYVELTNTATHNIPSGAYVVWKGILYKAISIIAIGDTLSGSNLSALSNGGLNDIASSIPRSIALKPGSNYIGKTILAAYNTGSGGYLAVFLPCDVSRISAISSVTLAANSVVFSSEGRYGLDGSELTAADTGIQTVGITFEIPYPTQQTPNIAASLLTNGLTIVCT